MDDINPYELLDIPSSSTDQEIKTAYRKTSLKVHPDRNPNNPEAAAKFHELNQAYELLLDPLRRLALDARLRSVQAKKERFESYDKKRKEMVVELEERERAFKRQKMDKMKEDTKRRDEEEKIKEAGRRMREQAQAAVAAAEQEQEQEQETEIPQLGPLDTTVRVKYQLSSHPTLSSAEALATLFSQFGEIDSTLIVLKLKKKTATALIPFKQLVHSYAAVCNSNQASRQLQGIEVTWASGKGEEPPLLAWLRKIGKLDSSSSFSSPKEELPSTTATSIPGLDYEDLTLLRLRQAERERLEKEILEAEARGEEAS